ncbi:MAG: PAS domain S-box protein [Anaerolineales bacterium]|nr:PAS domain S-box protein [Anaerolineales bacterium]
MEMEPLLHQETLPFRPSDIKKSKHTASKNSELSVKRLHFFSVVVAIVNTTLVFQALGDFLVYQSSRWLAPISIIYLAILVCWHLARYMPWLTLAILHLILLIVTGSAVHLAGGALSVSGAYYVFLAVVTGLLVLGSDAGLALSITCGIAYIVLGTLELAGVFPVTDSVFGPLYKQGFNILALGQMVAAGTIVFFAAALSRLIAISMHRDIQEKSNLYAAAERSRLEWEATFSAITEGISVHDESLTIVHANPALAKILGVGINELEGQPGKKIFSGWYKESSPLARCLAKNKMQTYRVDMPPGLSGNFRITVYPVNAADNRVIGVVQIIQDITQEQEIQAQLIQTEKIAVLGRMVASLAHEINNPLQAIKSGLGLLKKPHLAEEKRVQYLDVASTEVNRLIAITERLLDFERPSSNKVTPTNLGDVIDEVLLTAGKTLKDRGIRPSTNIEKLPLIELAPDQVKQVFMNLTLNSLDALPRGGELLISAICPRGETGIMPEIQVSFTITGVAPEKAEFTSIDAWNGKGSGLTASCRIIEALGGNIKQNNTANTITVFLPLEKQLAEMHETNK